MCSKPCEGFLHITGVGWQIPPRFLTPFKRGTPVLELSAPHGTDLQRPHMQDELYIAQAGQGTFDVAGAIRPFAPGGPTAPSGYVRSSTNGN